MQAGYGQHVGEARGPQIIAILRRQPILVARGHRYGEAGGPTIIGAHDAMNIVSQFRRDSPAQGVDAHLPSQGQGWPWQRRNRGLAHGEAHAPDPLKPGVPGKIISPRHRRTRRRIEKGPDLDRGSRRWRAFGAARSAQNNTHTNWRRRRRKAKHAHRRDQQPLSSRAGRIDIDHPPLDPGKARPGGSDRRGHGVAMELGTKKSDARHGQ